MSFVKIVLPCCCTELDHEAELDKISQGTDVEEPFSPTRETFTLELEKSCTFLPESLIFEQKSVQLELSDETSKTEKQELAGEQIQSQKSSVSVEHYTDDFRLSQSDDQTLPIMRVPDELALHSMEGYAMSPQKKIELSWHSTSGKAALDSDATYRLFVGPVLQETSDDIEDDYALSPSGDKDYHDLIIEPTTAKKS